MSLDLVVTNIAGFPQRLPAASTPESGASTAAPAAPAAGPASADPINADAASNAASPGTGEVHLTAGFTVVVMEVLNDRGNVVMTVPSAQQLAAYRSGSQTPSG